jgi:hypothetical protein
VAEENMERASGVGEEEEEEEEHSPGYVYPATACTKLPSSSLPSLLSSSSSSSLLALFYYYYYFHYHHQHHHHHHYHRRLECDEVMSPSPVKRGARGEILYNVERVIGACVCAHMYCV